MITSGQKWNFPPPTATPPPPLHPAAARSNLRPCTPNPTTGNSTLDCLNGLGSPCPPGLFCDEGGVCRCRASPNDILVCFDDATPSVLNCNCVTFDCVRNVTLAGNCLHTCGNKVNLSNGYYFYTPLPDSFNGSRKVCRDMNREGVLCGKCLDGYSPLAYSYNMTCVRCPHARWNWAWYILAAYAPLTLFCFLIVILRINVSSSYFQAIVIHCQVITMPAMLRILLRTVELNFTGSYLVAAKVLFSFYGIWNLDFFRPFYSDLCLGIGTLPNLALDYIIAVYPLFLMFVSYLLITLYDRNCRVITFLWSPFRRLFSHFRRNWDIRTSIIDACATFFFLSNTKFLSVSFDLLVPTKVYKLHGANYSYFLGLYYAQDIEYFLAEHRPYAVLAIVTLCVFVVLPVALLLVYPFRIFQRFFKSLSAALPRPAHLRGLVPGLLQERNRAGNPRLSLVLGRPFPSPYFPPGSVRRVSERDVFRFWGLDAHGFLGADHGVAAVSIRRGPQQRHQCHLCAVSRDIICARGFSRSLHSLHDTVVVLHACRLLRDCVYGPGVRRVGGGVLGRQKPDVWFSVPPGEDKGVGLLPRVRGARGGAPRKKWGA